MAVRNRMSLRPCGRRIQQARKAALWFDLRKICAVLPQVSKQGRIIRRYALPDDRNSEPAHSSRLRRHSHTQAIAVNHRGVSKRIQLMRVPEILRQLLNKLSRKIDPIQMLQFGRKRELKERLKPLFDLRGRKRAQDSQFAINRRAFRRELKIIVNHFLQQAGHKGERELLDCTQMVNRQLSSLGRITTKLLGFEFTWKHSSYNNSGTGLPCASDGENPIIAPKVGTRSIDCIGRS